MADLLTMCIFNWSGGSWIHYEKLNHEISGLKKSKTIVYYHLLEAMSLKLPFCQVMKVVFKMSTVFNNSTVCGYASRYSITHLSQTNQE
jgi:hypothetical protein